MPDWTFYNLKDVAAPRINDIALCRFPFEEDPSTPPPRRSPCLVLSVRINSKLNIAYVKVSFGTSNLKALERGHVDLLIQKDTTLNRLSLYQATRFELSRKKIAELPWAEEWFPCPHGMRHPVISRLDAELIGTLAAIRKRRAQAGFWD